MNKTIIVLTVLSEEPIDESLDIDDIVRECDIGDFVLHSTSMATKKLSIKEMAKALSEAGSEPEFFGIGVEE